MLAMSIPPEQIPDDLMTLTEAAEEFSQEKLGRFRGIKSAETLRSWNRQKPPRIRFYRIGASPINYVSRADVEKCLEVFIIGNTGDDTAEG